MFNRRSFFKRVVAVVAVVAMAPEIAFNRRLQLVGAPLEQLTPFWTQTSRWARAQSQAYLDWQIYQVTDTAYAS